jgi:hypothetical protein
MLNLKDQKDGCLTLKIDLKFLEEKLPIFVKKIHLYLFLLYFNF